MKCLFLLISGLLPTILYGQESQNFSFIPEGNFPELSDHSIKLKLPFELEVTEDFKDFPHNIIDISDGSFTLEDGMFSKGELSLLNDSLQIKIENERRVISNIESNKKIEKRKIKPKKGNSNPISLPFDFESDSFTDFEDSYKPGYIYYDAIKLSDDNVDISIKKKILISYDVDFTNSRSNPYLNDLITSINDSSKLQEDETSFGSLITNLGKTDVTYFAAGLARFLAERTKEELNEAFFNKMKKQLNTYPELKTAFPKTTSFLDIIDTYSYSSVIQILKEAFETDVLTLPENLYNIKGLTISACNKIDICEDDKECNRFTNCQLRLTKLAEFFATQNGHWVSLAMFSVKEGIKSTNPADLLKSIVYSSEFTNLKTTSTLNKKYDDFNIATSIELSNFISQSLISKEDKQVWISTNQLNTLFNSKDAFKIYLGLLLAKELKGDIKVQFYNSIPKFVSFGNILSENYPTYSQFESLIKNTYSAYNAANNAIKKMITASENSVETDPQALYDYYRTLTSSMNSIVTNQILNTLVGKNIGAEYTKVERFLNPAIDIAFHLSTKKYSSAIYDASILLTALNDIKITTTYKGKTKEEKYDGFKTVTKSFIKYGTLISTVATAHTSEEVKQAMEASVLPVGSYSIKRKTNWSMSINSYVGAYWNYANEKEYLPSLGLTAPVGFNISKGFSATGKSGGLSLNIQIVDVGALVNYYLLKGDDASIPNDFRVRLSNIFGPGFNFCYNIPKVPLSIAWGGQYLPTLYQYEQINGTNQLTPTDAFRLQISIMVDIPMFNLKIWDF